MFIPGLFILSVFFCFQNVSCAKKLLCNFEDSDCLTNIARKTYDDTVSGCLKDVPSSDPLNVDVIEGSLPAMTYSLHNVTFSGLGNCSPELVKFNKNNFTVVYNIVCKRLVSEGQYDVQGYIGSIFFKGKGGFKKIYYDYVFLFTLECDHYFDKNEKLHIHIKNHSFDIEPRGKVIYNFKNLYKGDSEKSVASYNFTNENCELIDKVGRGPAMKQLMKFYINNVNTYLKVVPIENILAHEI